MTNATIYTVDTIKNAINHIAPNHKVKQVQLFGSYADNTATEKSDIDLLVEFGERPLTIWDIAGFKLALCEYLNIDIEDVDIVQLPLSREATEDLDIKKVVQMYG